MEKWREPLDEMGEYSRQWEQQGLEWSVLRMLGSSREANAVREE
jgi:hypothetical protein